jgi:hypothetical protein
MSDAIPVQPHGHATGHPTIEAAIDGAKRHPKQRKAHDDAALLAGRHFVDARCDLQQWALEFSGPAWLHVFANEGGVDWRVATEPPVLNTVSEPIVFEWRSGGMSEMDCRGLSTERRGAEFALLWVNEFGLYVYLKNRLILSFHAVKHCETGEIILFACNDD